MYEAKEAVDLFHASQNLQLFSLLENKLEQCPDLQKYKDAIFSNARLAIGFTIIKRDDYSSKGNTRFGGLPDLPPGMDFPKVAEEWEYPCESHAGRLCQFIAQINFSELRGMQDYLPESGILYFFIESQFLPSPVICDVAQVFYYDGDVGCLQSANDLSVKPEDIFDFHESGEIKPACVRIFPHVSILNTYAHNAIYPPMNCGYAEFGPVEAHELIDELNGKLSGEHDAAINAHVFTQCSTPYEDAAKMMGGKPEDYVILLRVDSDQDICGFCFGDAGYLYFVIAKERLKHKDFSQIYCFIES